MVSCRGFYGYKQYRKSRWLKKKDRFKKRLYRMAKVKLSSLYGRMDTNGQDL